jgi:HD-like signal output (HDOD) protein
MLAEDTGLCYLSGLLHNIGKVVALGAIHELAQRAGATLASEDYDLLIESFHGPIGVNVVSAWALPAPVLTVTTDWEACTDEGPAGFASNVVNVAHTLADFTLEGSTHLARSLLMMHGAYRNLGLTAEDGEPLFDSAAAINAELDGYLAP